MNFLQSLSTRFQSRLRDFRRPKDRYMICFTIEHDGYDYHRNQVFGLTELPTLKECIDTLLPLYFDKAHLPQAKETYQRDGRLLLPDGVRVLKEIGYEVDYWAMIEQP